jgi:polysaccharide export outer membrane protein
MRYVVHAIAAGVVPLLLACLAFAAEAQTPLSDSYRLGAGDQVVIAVFGEPDLSMTFRLNDTGQLSYPFLGELAIEGLTVTELEQLITSGLKGPYLVDPEVTVSIAEYRPFFVHGEVQRPGAYPYQPGMTLEKAIVLAGGFTERASRRKFEVIRASDPGSAAQAIELSDLVFPDDVVTVRRSFF